MSKWNNYHFKQRHISINTNFIYSSIQKDILVDILEKNFISKSSSSDAKPKQVVTDILVDIIVKEWSELRTYGFKA